MLLLTPTLTLLALAAGPAATPAGPHLGPDDFAARRERLMQSVPPDALIVLHAAPVPEQEVDALYRQDSDFWYLTGFGEPEAVAVLRPAAVAGQRYTLFVLPRKWEEEQWTGWRAGVEGARERYAADAAYPARELWDRMASLVQGASALYVHDAGDDGFREQLESVWAAAAPAAPGPVKDLDPLVDEMRLIKDAPELAILRHAVDLSVDAHLAAMRATRPGAWEYQLQAAMVGTCIAGGAPRMGYPPIVASGPNSVVLHYPDASRRLEAGDSVVNDTACEYDMYSADVTRSYPASGRFSDAQRQLYEIVLAAQKAGIAAARPGARLSDVYAATVRVVAEGLVRLGILSGDVDELIASRAFFRFYPHGSSHWLGLNVHDVGSYETADGATDRPDRYFAANRVLEPGMVLTIEPGIYVRRGETRDRRWWDTGIRIEDDILVTPDGNECLSCRAPREIDAVEAALGSARQ